jgi:thiol-disulfide isomerase/thioredoxin
LRLMNLRTVLGPALFALASLSVPTPVLASPPFEGDGRVVAVDPAKGTVTLDHGPIQGLMGAMRMAFPVKAADLLHELRAGDVVRFSLEPRGTEWVIASVTPTGGATRSVTFPAPDFTLLTLPGESVRLSDFRGKAVLLNFWATWCVPCRTEMPTIEGLYQRYKAQGLEVLAVNLDRLSVVGVETFLKEVRVTFRVALDPSWSTTQPYGVVGLPTTYLIDRAGNVVVREVGERDWTDEITQAAVKRLLQ